MPRSPIYFGEGLDRETGLQLMERTRFQDLRNVLLHEGKVMLRPGFLPAGSGNFPAVDQLLAGEPLKSQAVGIVVGFNSTTRRMYIYRVSPDLAIVELVGEWVHDLASGWGNQTPVIIMAEVFGRVFMAHNQPFVSRRAPTIYYDGITGGDLLNSLTATWAGTSESVESIESAESNAESVVVQNAIRFRGVVRHLSYLVGWGFGSVGEIRPELVRISLPGEPTQFDVNHYFVAGDRRNAVIACGPSGTTGDEGGGILNVWKRNETHAIYGYDRRTFGIRLIDSRYGIVAARAWVNIDGVAIAWSEEGPRAWTGLSASEQLETPLALDEWEPTDLQDEGTLNYAYAFFVPRQRTAWFVFDQRVYALTARIPTRWRWSYHTLGFPTYGAMTFFAATEGAFAPPGYPVCSSVTPAGTFIDILVGNVNQVGDELIEVWIRNSSPGGIEKSATGKLFRAVFDDATEDFDAADWAGYGNVSPGFLIHGTGRFEVNDHGSAAPNIHGAILTAVAARGRGMVQARIARIDNGGGARYVGIMGQTVINDNGFGAPNPDIDGYAFAKSTDGLFNNEQLLQSYNNSTAANEDSESPGVFVSDSVYFNCALYWATDVSLESYNSVDDNRLEDPGAPTNPILSGQPGFIATGALSAGAVALMRCEEFYYSTNKLIVSILPVGWKLKILDAGDVVLAEGTADGSGQVTIDTLDVWLADAVDVMVTDSSDNEQFRTTPADGVWGGDTYSTTLGPGVEWELAATIPVSAVSSQTIRISDLIAGSDYEIALRYRRGLLYNAGAEDESAPENWPSISRCETTTTIDPPTINSATWSRVSAGVEQIELDITPLAGSEAEDIDIWRAPEIGGAPGTPAFLATVAGPHVGDIQYQDQTVSGETAYYYYAVTSATADSPLSTGVRAWAGPAAVPDFAYFFFGSNNYTVGFTTSDPTLDTELHDNMNAAAAPDFPASAPMALRVTVGAGVTEIERDTGFIETDDFQWNYKLRHALTQFAVQDFGEFGPTLVGDFPHGGFGG